MPGEHSDVLVTVIRKRLGGRLKARSPLLVESLEFWNGVVAQ